jgi:hypothetical protein
MLSSIHHGVTEGQRAVESAWLREHSPCTSTIPSSLSSSSSSSSPTQKEQYCELGDANTELQSSVRQRYNNRRARKEQRKKQIIVTTAAIAAACAKRELEDLYLSSSSEEEDEEEEVVAAENNAEVKAKDKKFGTTSKSSAYSLIGNKQCHSISPISNTSVLEKEKRTRSRHTICCCFRCNAWQQLACAAAIILFTGVAGVTFGIVQTVKNF